jgi:hypothetical protein
MIRQKDDVLDKYMAAWGQATLCKAKIPLEECDALILGSLMKVPNQCSPTSNIEE